MDARIREVQAGRQLSSGGRVTFTAAARRAALRHFEARFAQGVGRAEVAAELGLAAVTLQRWAATARPVLRPVQLMADEREPARVLVAVLNGVVRVEGLGLEDVARLARLLA